MRNKALCASIIAMLILGGCSSGAKPASSSAVGSSSAPAASSTVTAQSSSASSQAVSSAAPSSIAAPSSSAAPRSVAPGSSAPQSSSAVTAKTVQQEMAEIEAKSEQFMTAASNSMAQQDANMITAEWYQMWDDELNSLWDRLMERVEGTRRENVLIDQRNWVKEKEEKVAAAGKEAEGGSLQPQLENGAAMRLTRLRAYHLAALLGEVNGEGFNVPENVQKEILEENRQN